MNTRWRLRLVGLGLAILLALAYSIVPSAEPVYQGKPLSYWVTRLGSDEMHGAPKDAVAAIRAIGPKAVPFLLEWMPHRQSRGPAGVARIVQWCLGWLQNLHGVRQDERKTPASDCVEFAWWALGTNGKSAIPALSRVISQPPVGMDGYSAWTVSAKAISYLGPDAILPMLTAATNMHGRHEVWELLHNFENLGTNGAPAVPALLGWANDPDYFVRSGVVSALGGIGKRAKLAVPALLAGLHDSNSMVRRDAAQALGAFADDSDEVLPELIKTLNGDDWQARGGALSGLGCIRSRPETVIPLITPYLSDGNSVVGRSAAYALRDLGSQAGYRALLQATNAPRDIVYEVVEMISSEDAIETEKRRQDIFAKLAQIYGVGEAPQLPILMIEGRPVSEILSKGAVAGMPLRLEQILALHTVTNAEGGDIATFELPLSYEAVTNLGTLRLLCDADPAEKAGNEAMVQQFERAANGNCRLVWDTSYDAPGQHFLQAEVLIYRWPGHSHPSNINEQEVPLKGPLYSFMSTNTVQFFPGADGFTQYGAFFRVKLAQPVGFYSLELTTPSGQHIHTITGSTTNGMVEARWDLLCDDGKRYTNESFNSIWTVTFPDSRGPGSNTRQAAGQNATSRTP
jgi:hypothetical protein